MALFDADRRLVWSSGFEPATGDAMPSARVERGTLHQQALAGWFDRRRAPRGLADTDGLRQLDWGLDGEVDVQTWDGQRVCVAQRGTPEGGALVVVVDRSMDGRQTERVDQRPGEVLRHAKAEVLGWLSHELRTPLNAMLGFAQLMQRDVKDALSARQRARVDQIVNEGGHLVRRMDEMLDLSRIDHGGLSLSVVPTDVLDIVQAVRASLATPAVRARVELAIVNDSENVPRVLADRGRLVQILMNLGANGIKYNRPRGSVTFTLSIPREGVVRISVSDTGIGIPAERQATLFDPFRAGEPPGSLEGRGIGLALAHRLAEVMSFELGFRSVWAKGSEFWLDMPACATG
jgi:signal transduction histidine kinase